MNNVLTSSASAVRVCRTFCQHRFVLVYQFSFIIVKLDNTNSVLLGFYFGDNFFKAILCLWQFPGGCIKWSSLLAISQWYQVFCGFSTQVFGVKSPLRTEVTHFTLERSYTVTPMNVTILANSQHYDRWNKLTWSFFIALFKVLPPAEENHLD